MQEAGADTDRAVADVEVGKLALGFEAKRSAVARAPVDRHRRSSSPTAYPTLARRSSPRDLRPAGRGAPPSGGASPLIALVHAESDRRDPWNRHPAPRLWGGASLRTRRHVRRPARDRSGCRSPLPGRDRRQGRSGVAASAGARAAGSRRAVPVDSRSRRHAAGRRPLRGRLRRPDRGPTVAGRAPCLTRVLESADEALGSLGELARKQRDEWLDAVRKTTRDDRPEEAEDPL